MNSKEALLCVMLPIAACASNNALKAPQAYEQKVDPEEIPTFRKKITDMAEGVYKNPDGTVSAVSCYETKDLNDGTLYTELMAESEVIHTKCQPDEAGRTSALMKGSSETDHTVKPDGTLKVCSRYTADPYNIVCLKPLGGIISIEEMDKAWDEEMKKRNEEWNKR